MRKYCLFAQERKNRFGQEEITMCVCVYVCVKNLFEEPTGEK